MSLSAIRCHGEHTWHTVCAYAYCHLLACFYAAAVLTQSPSLTPRCNSPLCVTQILDNIVQWTQKKKVESQKGEWWLFGSKWASDPCRWCIVPSFATCVNSTALLYSAASACWGQHFPQAVPWAGSAASPKTCSNKQGMPNLPKQAFIQTTYSIQRFT